MIPDEAVEAAAKALALKTYNKEFGTMDDYTQSFLRDSARLALEAAAPYMLPNAQADAWDKGSQDRWDYQWSDGIEPLTNPYRTQEADRG